MQNYHKSGLITSKSSPKSFPLGWFCRAKKTFWIFKATVKLSKPPTHYKNILQKKKFLYHSIQNSHCTQHFLIKNECTFQLMKVVHSSGKFHQNSKNVELSVSSLWYLHYNTIFEQFIMCCVNEETFSNETFICMKI